MKNIAIILASGTGERTGLNIPKQFIKIGGKMVIEHTIDTFESVKSIDEIIIVSHINFVEHINSLIVKNDYRKVSKVLIGGATRRESSYIGISSIGEIKAKVLIHDAVRPFLNPQIIEDCIAALDKYNAVDVAIPSADTIICVDENNVIQNIPDREFLRRGQTPQAFQLETIKKAHELALKDTEINVTDDCGLVLKYDLGEIYVVKGDDFNRKITYPLDVAVADKLFQLKTNTSEAHDKTELKDKVVVIFGASRGIGESIVELASRYGAKVYGFSRQNGVDVADGESIKNALDVVKSKESKIHYIINTAGILRMGKLSCRDEDDILNEININYIGSVNVARLALDYLKETKGGLLLYTSSSYTKGRALYSIYSSTKSAIVNLSQALAEEWQDSGVKINCICPERTATPMRFENFGKEPNGSLCPVEKVAEVSLNTLLGNFSGQIIDVRKDK